MSSSLAAANFSALLPPAVAAEVVASVAEDASALLKLARQVQMPTGTEIIPVVSGAPAAGWVDPVTGLKPRGDVTWQPLTLTAAEVGVLVPLPDAFVSDAAFSPWASARVEIVKAFTSVIESAGLYGTNAPAGWPVGGVTAPAYADAVTGPDALAAIDAAMSKLETDGITPTGVLGAAALRAALRQQSVHILQPFSEAPASIFGVPIEFTSNWDDTKSVALIGGFENVIAGLRTDLTWSIADQAVITDAAGVVKVNAYQQDVSILRCFWRIALQVAEPLGPEGTPVKPLALAQATGTAAARRSAKA
jgi:HK97 family phage major capsid protein